MYRKITIVFELYLNNWNLLIIDRFNLDIDVLKRGHDSIARNFHVI